MRLLLCVSVSVLLLGRSGARDEQCRLRSRLRCGDSDRCVSEFMVCDGHASCKNGWDELNCTSCKAGSFLCDGSRCVSNAHKCDGVAWCRDGADEDNCANITSEPECKANSRCNGVWGDGCWTRDDELLCTPEMCQPPATRDAYSGGRCRDPNARCDGVLNFRDETDEVNCTQCNGGALFCNGHCTKARDVCDGYSNCPGDEDELNCTSCKEGSFLCDGSRCVRIEHTCDGVAWCRDGADEANCTSIKSKPYCEASSRCNGEWGDCITRDDELGCTPQTCQLPATREAYSGGRCRDPNARCNGVENFSDETDENNCTECNGGAIFCNGHCKDARNVCNGYSDCPGDEDELNCTSCKEGSFLCDGSRCVAIEHKCDGVTWCRDGADEANCTSIKSDPTCAASSRCNGVRGDCWLGDDERGCDPQISTPGAR